jgi:hypothetical protein
MALKILQPGVQPLGQFDGLDGDLTSLLGGEVVTFASVTSLLSSGTDLSASDSADGYVNGNGTVKRTVVTKTLSSGKRPLMLADEGISGYGTLLGRVVGGTVGTVTAGSVLGPHTTAGSGKITCWDKPGLYAVSLDACATNATTGLQPTNPTLAAGDKLYATTAGVITPVAANGFDTGTTEIGRFVSFESDGSLVKTPNKLVNGLSAASSFSFAVFHFNVE